eukprot:199415-Pelagomonas_calceolata.AAC.5
MLRSVTASLLDAVPKNYLAGSCIPAGPTVGAKFHKWILDKTGYETNVERTEQAHCGAPARKTPAEAKCYLGHIAGLDQSNPWVLSSHNTHFDIIS